MAEFVTISAPSTDATSLASRLTQKSAEGWDVVAIVPTGADITAFLKRESTGAVAATAPSGATEPAGWATAPGSTATAASSAPAAASTTTVATQSTATNATATVPSGWYNDPSGRFELRYWDGSTWTEHVARGGQQFTDPPVV
jgi:hypothetical protein